MKRGIVGGNKMTIKEPEIKNIEIDKIKVDVSNPNKMNQDQFEALKKTIKKFGYLVPVILDKELRIADGEHRYLAYKEMGMKQIPAYILDITDPDRRILRQVMNKLKGEHDYELDLKEFEFFQNKDKLKELFELVPNEDIDKVLSDLDTQELREDVFDVEEELKKIKEPFTKIGDIYQLGNHRVICGDSTDSKIIEKLMNGKKADMIITDPPYNIGYEYHNEKYKGKTIFDDNRKEEEYAFFINKLIENSIKFSKDNIAIYFWCDESKIYLTQNIYNKRGIKNKRVCLWVKENFNPTPQIGFNKVYEACVLGWKGKPFINKKEKKWSEILNFNTNLMDYFNIWFVHRDNKQQYNHPTQKPIELLFKPMRINSKRKDLILDLCGGSGSTLIACEQLDRKGYIAELDPYFCDVIIKRWENLTGKKAKKL